MSVVIDFIADIGLEAVKDKAVDKVQQTEVNRRLNEYLARQKKLNFNVGLDEEIDFQGLAEYIKGELLEDVKLRLFGNKRERREARTVIVSKAATYATAHTNLSSEKTKKIVSTSVDILRDFYQKKVNRDLRLIAAQVEDSITEEITAHTQEMQELINLQSGQIKETLQRNSLLSLDNNIGMARSGQINDVGKNIAAAMDVISTTHCLYPHYGYRMNTKNRMVSFPLTSEAALLYPPKMNVSATAVKLGDEEIKSFNRAILEQSYRHQLPISFDIVTAKKMLGDFDDPIQDEAIELRGSHFVAIPQKFPPAFPCCVIIGGDIIVPYLLLRVVEILDDDTFVVTNSEQKDFPFNVRFEMNPEQNKIKFTINIDNLGNRELLAYRKVVKRIQGKETVALRVLPLGQNLCEGIIDDFVFPDLDEEIKLLEKVIKLEDYFKCDIGIPEEITIDDYNTLNHLCSLIDGEVTGTWSEFNCSFYISAESKKRILELDDEKSCMGYSTERTFEVFGEKYTLPVFISLESAVVKDLCKVKQKAEVCDEGDQIKVMFVPSEDDGCGKFREVIYTENIKNKLTTTI